MPSGVYKRKIGAKRGSYRKNLIARTARKHFIMFYKTTPEKSPKEWEQFVKNFSCNL